MKLSNKALKICIMFLLLVTTVFGERVVTLPGTIQSALGGKDWAPDDYITRMKEVSEDLYIFEASLSKGNYDYKVAIDGSWTENYGSNGAKDGVDIPLVITTDNTKVKFTFDYKNKTIKHEIPEIEGFFFMPIVTSKVEQKGIDAPLLVTNELELGVLSKSWVVKSKFNYNFEHDDDKANKLTNIGDDADIKNLKIAELNADYTTKGITTGIMVNKANLKNSKDYLGIFDVDTETNKRHDGRKNPVNIAANSYGVKLSTEKFAKFDFATVKYVDDIYEKSDTERTFTQLNLEKSLLKDKLTLGTSNLLYQVTLDGKDEDLLINSALYAKLALSNKLTIKGELAYIPTGSILESKGLQVLYKGGTTWEFTVTPISFGIKDEITDMHLVGNLGGDDNWNAASKTYPMVKNGDVWVGTFTLPNTLNVADTKVKFVYNGSTWDKNIGIGGQDGSDFPLAEVVPKGEGLKNGFNAYYADLDYKLGNKGSIQAGTKFVAENSYMPFAKDDLLYRENYDSIVNRKNGIVDYWLNADYQLSKNNKLIAKQFIRNTDKDDMKVNNETILTLENKGIKGTEYIKATFTNDTVAKDFHFGNKDYQVISLETKLDKLPLLKYAKLSTDQRLGAETSKYYLETELKDTLYFINYIKCNLTYAIDDEHYAFQGGDALQYWAEIKFTDVPLIYPFVPYITLSYESDDNGNDGIIERKAYYNKDDNNNDWLKKIKAETKLSHESLNKWDGLTIAYEMRKIEEDRTKDKTPSDFTKDEQYYLASERTFIDWYSMLTLSTGYTFPKEIKGKVTYKYDLVHENRSEFEDDAFKVELEKKFGKKVTLNGSYNIKDKDNGKNYAKVVLKTVF